MGETGYEARQNAFGLRCADTKCISARLRLPGIRLNRGEPILMASLVDLMPAIHLTSTTAVALKHCEPR
jgi:hypothetical protein